MAGLELEKYADGHEMSNQQSEKQSLTNTTQSWRSSWGIPSLSTTLQLHFSALHHLHLGPFETMVAGSCPKVPKLYIIVA